jgi:predicted methyltransferase MtxX (methanogen marker protein 4)
VNIVDISGNLRRIFRCITNHGGRSSYTTATVMRNRAYCSDTIIRW